MFLEKRIPIFGNRKKVDPDEKKRNIFERMLETNEQLIKPASATKLSTNFPHESHHCNGKKRTQDT